MFNTLEDYHFAELPKSIKDKAEKMIDDIYPLGILNEGTIDAVEVWGRDDILLLMRAMYNEARKTLALSWKDIKNLDHLLNVVDFENSKAMEAGKDIPFDGDSGFYTEVLRRFNEQRKK